MHGAADRTPGGVELLMSVHIGGACTYVCVPATAEGACVKDVHDTGYMYSDRYGNAGANRREADV